MKAVYYFCLVIGALLMLYFGFYLKYAIPSLILFIFVYRPIVDFVFIKKRELYKGTDLWKKYPFWGFNKKLLL